MPVTRGYEARQIAMKNMNNQVRQKLGERQELLVNNYVGYNIPR